MNASTNSGIRQLRARWDALTARQQRVSLITFTVFIGVLVLVFVWLPTVRANDRLQERNPMLARGLDAMRSDATEIAKLRQTSGAASTTTKSVADESALRAHFGEAFVVTRASASSFRVTTARAAYREWWDKVAEANAKFGLRIVRIKLTNAAPPSRDVAGDVELSTMATPPATSSAKP